LINRNKLSLFFVLVVLALVLSACGSKPVTEPVKTAGDETCFTCHASEEKLLADLAANPLQEKAKAESEGEG
jgi:hypothetical protein